MLRRTRRRVVAPRATRVPGAGHPASRRIRPPNALRILLVAFGLLFLQGPRLFHLLLVPHATCEHGELIELHPGHDGAASGPAPLAGRAGHEDGLGVAAPHPGEDRVEAARTGGSEHDHCDALALRHVPTAVSASVGAPSLLAITEPPALPRGAETRPVPLLSLAPKSSPPVS